ncbi:hypothetical protein CRG98_028596 [Punica granatum]|uniref:Uncharacterized protein n=1 Tax=Punica granatum TaxID=22663 RepID=A0A2I0J451_PUNGR|nr:hypothetical protein CRG98_028596 [Punica granatum]
MKAGMDARDSSGHRRHSAVVDRDLTGAQSVGIGGKSHDFPAKVPSSSTSKFAKSRANFLFSFPGSSSSLSQSTFCLF